MRKIPFSSPYITGHEIKYLSEVIESGKFTGGGPFLAKCEDWLRKQTSAADVLLTTSCTSALDMAALLADVGPEDEVIMPSFTFVSTANAFVLRGAVPVFVDCRADTLNIDETKIEAAITGRTKAIVPVHYAGIGCAMDRICQISEQHQLMIIEDAAQGFCATTGGRPLGTIGALGAYSFHDTKNVVAGEGGALLVNDERLLDRAQTIREKGTNRRKFLAGKVDKYSWVDVGSAYLPSELAAAVLFAQLEAAETITEARLSIWTRYHDAFGELERQSLIKRPSVPSGSIHNGHIYYVLLADQRRRDIAIEMCNKVGIGVSSHFVPLHSAPAGMKYSRVSDDLSTTEDAARRLLRLPLFAQMSDGDVDYVIENFARMVRAL